MGVAAPTEDGIECLAVGAPFHQGDFSLAFAGAGVDDGVVGWVLVLVEVDDDFRVRRGHVPGGGFVGGVGFGHGGGEIDVVVRGWSDHVVCCRVLRHGGSHGEEEWEDGDEGFHCDHLEGCLKMMGFWVSLLFREIVVSGSCIGKLCCEVDVLGSYWKLLVMMNRELWWKWRTYL